jgi:hypothetical protein
MKKGWLTLWLIFLPLFTLAQWTGSYSMLLESAPGREMVTVWLNFMENKIAMEMHVGQGAARIRTIYDLRNKTMTTASEKDGSHKYAMVMKLHPELIEKNTEDIRYTPTDDQRIIDGFRCQKTIAETTKDISEIWLTTELNLSYEHTLGMIPHTKNNPTAGYLHNLKQWKGLKGFPLEIVSYAKDKPEEKSYIRFKDIRTAVVDTRAFDLSGYQFVELPPPVKEY